MHKSQVFFYLLSAFILGVFFSSVWVISDKLVLVFVVVGLAGIALSYNNKFGLLAGFLILAFAVGGARFNSFDKTNDLSEFIGQDISLNGFIDSEPEVDGNRVRFVFRANEERVLVTMNAFPRREFGDELSINGKLELPQNFGEFDYITYLKKDGIQTVFFYPKEIKNASIDLGWLSRFNVMIYHNIFIVKDKFQNAINLSISEPNAAFINGILLGTRQNIPDDLKDAFSRTGTTHILAISGYNIMIISEVVLLCLIWFFKRRTAFWISVAVIILFVILTGASASVVRAAIMGLILSFANGYGRLYDQKNSIILAGAIMIYHNPFVLVFDVGFQLSFVAVFGLIYLYPWIDNKLLKIPKFSGLKEVALMTISAQVAVLPLIIYYFGGFSFISLPANILILPFIPYAMLFGFLTGLTGMFYLPAGQIFGYIAWAITIYQIEIVQYFSALIS